MENDSYEKGFVHENKKVAAELFYSYSFVKRIKVNQIKRSLNTFSILRSNCGSGSRLQRAQV